MTACYKTAKTVLRGYDCSIREDSQLSHRSNFVISKRVVNFPHHLTVFIFKFLIFPFSFKLAPIRPKQKSIRRQIGSVIIKLNSQVWKVPEAETLLCIENPKWQI